MNRRILVIEDEHDIADLLKRNHVVRIRSAG